MPEFRQLHSTAVSLMRDDVDTDQIIPASFLKSTGREGMADGLFAGWRLRNDGSPDPDFPLNRPAAEAAAVLLAGHNFGCGSSREHAAWALYDFGFRAVIAPSFADIFRANALRIGLLPLAVDRQWLNALVSAVASDPALEIEIDLKANRINWRWASTEFEIESFARHCLLEGIDAFSYLLAQEEDAAHHAAAHPVDIDTLDILREHHDS